MPALWTLMVVAVALCTEVMALCTNVMDLEPISADGTSRTSIVLSLSRTSPTAASWTVSNCGGMSLTTIPGDNVLNTANEKIQCLIMRRNNLTSLNTSSLNRSSLRNLDTLVMDDNLLTAVHPDTFRHLPLLRSVHLRRNQLPHLDRLTFSNNSMMMELSLSGNPLMLPTSGPFLSSAVLLVLRLDACNITSLPRAVFSELSSLRLLDLGANNLSTISEAPFASLRALTFLNLSSNALTVVSNNTISPLQHLQRLDLQKNLLESMNVKEFTPLTKLNRLEMGGNPLICACSLKPFRLWAQNRSVAQDFKCGEVSWDILLTMQC